MVLLILLLMFFSLPGFLSMQVIHTTLIYRDQRNDREDDGGSQRPKFTTL